MPLASQAGVVTAADVTRAGDVEAPRMRAGAGSKRKTKGSLPVANSEPGEHRGDAGDDICGWPEAVNGEMTNHEESKSERRSRRCRLLPGRRRRTRRGRGGTGGARIIVGTWRPARRNGDGVVDSRRARAIRWTRMISETRRSSWCSWVVAGGSVAAEPWGAVAVALGRARRREKGGKKKGFWWRRDEGKKVRVWWGSGED
jgi:hypothetical protein